MKQATFASLSFDAKKKRTRREVFLTEMKPVIPRDLLEAIIEPHYPKAGRRVLPPMPLSTMLRIHFMQQWYALSDPGMEDALYEIESMRRFARLDLTDDALPDETTILKFRRLLEKHDLAGKLLEAVNVHLGNKGLLLRQGTIVDATIIHAPSSTKDKEGKRAQAMHSTKKGNQYYFGMKAHIGVDVESGLVHTVATTAANAADVSQTEHLLHGKEKSVWGDAGYTGANKREGLKDRRMAWHIASKPGKVKAMPNGKLKDAARYVEYPKAAVRTKVEHPFRVIKRQFDYTKVRYRGLGEEHRSGADLVCVVESMDGASALVGDGMKAAAWMLTP